MQNFGAAYVLGGRPDRCVELTPLPLELGVVQVFFDQIGHPRRYWRTSGGLLDSARGPFGHTDGDAAYRHNISITYREPLSRNLTPLPRRPGSVPRSSHGGGRSRRAANSSPLGRPTRSGCAWSRTLRPTPRRTVARGVPQSSFMALQCDRGVPGILRVPRSRTPPTPLPGRRAPSAGTRRSLRPWRCRPPSRRWISRSPPPPGPRGSPGASTGATRR